MEELSSIEDCIESFANEFLQKPHIFWGESDAKSYLYHLLISNATLQKKYKTFDGKLTNLVHNEYKSRLGGRFDIAVFSPEIVEQYRFNNQRLLCGIELGLNQGSDHYALDFVNKFMKETGNIVDFGYLIHLMRDTLDYWDTTIQDIENNLMPTNSEFLIQPTRTDDCGIFVVKVRVKEQE